jgi:hypothetical protein
MQGGAARRQHSDLGHVIEEGREGGRGVADLLEVVEDQQQVEVAGVLRKCIGDRGAALVPYVERLRDGGQHRLAIVEVGKRDENNAVAELAALEVADFDSEPGFARAPRAGQRNEVNVRPIEQRLHLDKLGRSADQRR